MSYALLKVPDGYETDLALLVAPYFDPTFITKLVTALRPNKLRILVDDSVRNEDIQGLIDAVGAGIDVKLALAAAPGLVHIKCYYAEFVKADGRARRRRRLFYGSANATDAAFHGNRNAELIASTDLSVNDDHNLLNYLYEIIAGIETGTGRLKAKSVDPLRNSPTLHLPAFHIIRQGSGPGFDAWLQRGRLAAKYRDAQQFLAVSVTLKRSLPQGDTAEIFAAQGFMNPGNRNVVRSAYIADGNKPTLSLSAGDDEEGKQDSKTASWKSRYCIWTHLGDWLSDRCYEKHGGDLSLKTSNRRRARVERLLEYGNDVTWLSDQRVRFLSTLDKIWTGIKLSGGDPNEFLVGSNKGIHKTQYEGGFDKKVKADFRLAQDEDFKRRYVNGYDFPVVPKFRQDTPSWDAFVSSWCESICLELGKSSPRSLLVQKLKAIRDFEVEGYWDPDGLQRYLRKYWNHSIKTFDGKVSLGDHLTSYADG